MTKKDQLWVKLLEAKYFQGTNPFEPTKNYELSWIWTSIQKGLNILKGNYVWKVKNGENTRTWEDKWLFSTSPLSHPVDKTEPIPQKVNELLTSEGDWDIGKLDEFFSTNIKEKILAITPNKENKDKIRWAHHTSGNFSAKNIYNYLINQSNNDKENIDFPWKNICSLKTIPRIRLFIWKMVQKALPTNSR